MIFQHQFQWFNRINSHHLVLCSGQFLNHTSTNPPQESAPLPSEKRYSSKKLCFQQPKFIQKGQMDCSHPPQGALHAHLGGQVTCRAQHNSPPAARAGGPAAQRGFVPHLRLHDHIVFVLQLQKQHFEFLLFTQIYGTHRPSPLSDSSH